MSDRYPGGMITKAPVAPTAAAASGIWSLEQALQYIQAGTWPTPGDPYFKYVTMLLPGNGTNGANNLAVVDSSANAYTISTSNQPTQGSFSPYGTNWATSFYRSSDPSITISSSAQFAYGTGDFTWECWIFYQSLSGPSYVLDHGSNGGTISGSSGELHYYNSTVSIKSFGSDFVTNTWYHIAVSRASGTTKLFKNGAEVLSFSDSHNYGTQAVTIGSYGAGGGGYSWSGYISNLRLVKGTAVYTTSFTPSTTPLTAITNTVLLTCQSNYFKDNSTNNFTLGTNMSIANAPKITSFGPFGSYTPYSASTNGASIIFDGSNSLQVSSGTNLDGISGDFTIEFWIYRLADGSYEQYTNAGSTNVAAFKNSSTGWYYYDGAAYNFTGASRDSYTPLYAWSHMALVRSGSTLRLYINGVQRGSAPTYTGTINYASMGVANAEPPTTYMTDLRVVKGTAVYTSNFTPPTTPLTAVSGTQLLLNMKNASISDYAQKCDIYTRNSVTTSTATSKFGGSSIYFNNGTLLSYNTASSYEFSDCDFTIEMWIYMLSTGSGQSRYLYDGRGTADANSCPVILVNSSGNLQYDVGNTARITGGAISQNTWTFITLCRNAGTTKLYINGTQTGSSYADSNYYDSFESVPRLGTTYTYTGPFYGYMNDIRVTKYARYSGNFTAPTTAFITKG